MLQATLGRAGALPGAQAPLLVCNQEHRFLVREQCIASGHTPAAIYLEPTGRNTAPAIALVALHLAAADPEALMLVLPADHVIQNTAAFATAVADAAKAARAGYLVTFGVLPQSPDTAYGYIKAGAPLSVAEAWCTACAVTAFVEKPDLTTAQRYLAEGGYTWNSGMFVFTAGRYLEELQTHRPDIHAAATLAWQGRAQDLDFCRPDKAAFLACPADSIDYAVMQKTSAAAVVKAGFDWSDVGSWDSLWQIAPRDATGNALQGDVFVAQTNNSYVRSESRLVAVIGVDDVVVVETADAVLVMRRDNAQEIKRVIEHFDHHSRTEHLQHLRVYQPWGWYEGLNADTRFQVKHIMVKPGEKLSLQMHHHRSEHWVVVRGTAQVTVDGEDTLLTENQSTFIPLGHTHKLENPGKIDLHLIEVQSGTYLGEDDIVRFEDTYARTASV
jgi:mannose-1-phosphate guanylyltransferase/mannose-1-phosphate guanylyltransferase/mannose-6-phosphate isomerase